MKTDERRVFYFICSPPRVTMDDLIYTHRYLKPAVTDFIGVSRFGNTRKSVACSEQSIMLLLLSVCADKHHANKVWKE